MTGPLMQTRLAIPLVERLQHIPLTEGNRVLILALATLLTGILLIGFLFFYSRRPSSTVAQQLIADAIESKWIAERSSTLRSLEERVEIAAGDLALLEITQELQEDDQKREKLEQEIAIRKDNLEKLKAQLQENQLRIRNEAHELARQTVKETTLQTPGGSVITQGRFFLEYTTVIVVIIALIELAVLDT